MFHAKAFNASEEIRKAANYPSIRLFTAQLVSSDTPTEELLGIMQQWAVASPGQLIKKAVKLFVVYIIPSLTHTHTHAHTHSHVLICNSCNWHTCSIYQRECMGILLCHMLVLWQEPVWQPWCSHWSLGDILGGNTCWGMVVTRCTGQV